MKNNNKLLYLLIITLIIWNVILTSVLINNKNSRVEEIITSTNVTGFSTDLTNVVKDNKSTCVIVEVGSNLSSGVIYHKTEGKFYVVTTAHGLNNATSFKVTLASSKELLATLVGKDDYSDIAVLEVESDLEVKTITKGNSNLVKDGEFLMYIGTPKSKEFSLSSGLALVSSKLRTITNSITIDNKVTDYYDSYIQLNADVTNGNSGSPLFNMNGEFVGLITMKQDDVVLAIPENKIEIIANNIINDVATTNILFGVNGKYVKELENYEKNQLNISLDVNYGLYVNSVKLASFASAIGIKQGDIILTINDSKINNYNDLLTFVFSNAEDVNVTLIRNNEEINLVGSIDQ